MSVQNVHVWLAKENLPLVQRTQDEDGWRWYYLPDDEHKPENWLASVTNILSVVTHERLREYFRREPYKKQETKLEEAANLGTFIHTLIDRDLQGEKPTDKELIFEGMNLHDFYERWKKMRTENQIEATVLELPVVSQKYHYAGTLDFLGKFKDKSVVADLKSGRFSIKTGWQLAGYVHAYEEMSGQSGTGMVGINVPWNRPIQCFVYQHLSFCWDAFKHAYGVWRAMYFNKLKKMNWKGLETELF